MFYRGFDGGLIELNVIQPARIVNSKIKKTEKSKEGKWKKAAKFQTINSVVEKPWKCSYFFKVPITSNISMTIDFMISNIEDPMPEIMIKIFNSNMHLK